MKHQPSFAVGILLASLLGAPPLSSGKDLPTFEVRARVLTVAGASPQQEQEFNFHFDVTCDPVTAKGGEWSGWMKFGRKQVKEAKAARPSSGVPSVVGRTILSMDPFTEPTVIEAELKLTGSTEVMKLTGEYFDPILGAYLGIVIWRDDHKKLRATTMAEYNQRYWKAIEKVNILPEQRPKKFPIVDRFIAGDGERRNWSEGIEHLCRCGFSVIMAEATKPSRELLLKNGIHRTKYGVYNPPGYAFDFTANDDPAGAPADHPGLVEKWAMDQAKPYLDAGFAKEDMAIFGISDEPGWYFPMMYKPLTDSPVAMARFRDYIKSQKLEPVDVGASEWAKVMPGTRSQAKDLASRRLFYWTMRFCSWDSSRHFADCTRALEKAFYPGMPIFVNWNFFSGRSHLPGPFGNNPDKKSRDAAMGCHDWFEFGRMRGATLLWVEDWFPDSMAPQWSFYCSKLRCAAAKGGVQFGGYIIPRCAGDRPDGILQKILCVAGSGGKAIEYFTFGPEYNFPVNCYSENIRVLPKMAEAHLMIGQAEELLWPGTRPRPEVAILMPRSPQYWDAKNIPVPKQIYDCTNPNLNKATVDYLAEVANLYLALQHANIPVDFVDEDDLTPEGLKPYRVLYATGPNIPAEGQRGMTGWVNAGGTLVTVTGTGAYDRYDDPCPVLGNFTEIAEKPRERMLVANATALHDSGKGKGEFGNFTAAGPRGVVRNPKGDVKATFNDRSPAMIQRSIGDGNVVHFTWMPGLSYLHSSKKTRDGLPVDFSESIRRMIVHPTQLAHVQPPVRVDHVMVETPLLLSPKGAAVTMLNWSGEPVKQANLHVNVPFNVQSVESVKRGKLPFQKSTDGYDISLPLDAADIVMLHSVP